MNQHPKHLWVPCSIENSGFSSERRFEVDLRDRGKAVGVAYIEYLKHANGADLTEDEPPYGETIAGLVQCRILGIEGDEYLVEFPSSDVFHVPPEALRAEA